MVFTPDTVHPRLKEGQHLQTDLLSADRGAILDAAGEAIVKARATVTVGVEPQRITNQSALIAALDAAFKSVQTTVDLSDLPGRIKAAKPDAFVEVVTLRREVYDQIRSQIVDGVRAGLDPAVFDTAYARGRAMGLDAVLTLADPAGAWVH